MKAWFRWLVDEGSLSDNPVQRIKGPRVPNPPLEPVTIEQVKAMLAVCDPKGEIGARDRAVILCLLDSRLRASEMTALNRGDLNLESGAMIVRHGKGDKQRVTFLGAKSRRELLRYLRFRGDTPVTAPLFAGDDGGRLRYESLRDIIRRRARDAGTQPPTLHSFRRAFALTALRNGMDVYSLQKLMGHADLTVLRRYLAQTEGDLREAHQRAGVVDRLL
jgi:site-specific recombinase XerD